MVHTSTGQCYTRKSGTKAAESSLAVELRSLRSVAVEAEVRLVGEGRELGADLAQALDPGCGPLGVADGVQVGGPGVLVDAQQQSALVAAPLRDQGLEALPGGGADLL